MRVCAISIATAAAAFSLTQLSAAAAPAGNHGAGTFSASAQGRGGPKSTTPNPHGNPHQPATNSTGSTTPAPSGTTSGSPTTATPPQPLNPIAQKIASNHGLLPKVTGLLPKDMTLNQASLGFKNQGQFIAALHVSRNLDIPFADLKTAMTGITPLVGTGSTGSTVTSSTATQTTTTPLMSLGQAIHKLKPSADSTTEATTGERQAGADVNSVAPTKTTKTTTTTSSNTTARQ